MTKAHLGLGIAVFFASFFICFSSPSPTSAADFLFNSGFEADSHVTGNYKDIAGVDHSVPPPNNWDDSSVLRDFDFNYGGGSSSERHGDIVDDPSGNDKALQLWLKDASGGGVRSTTQIHSFRGNEWFSRRKVYIHPDFLLLKNFSGGSRVMFEEIKVQQTSVNPNFRITAAWGNLTKSNFSWDIEAEELRGPSYWTCNPKTAVPIGEWFTLETYYKKGDASNGRYILTFQKAGGSKQTICDITNWTYSPELGPHNSIWIYNPMKLYMSKGDDVDWIRNNGGVAQLYFDDWEIWSTMPNGTPPPSTPTPGPTPTPPTDPSTKFKIGDGVEVTQTANVKTTAGEGLLGTQPPGAHGTVLGGPEIGIGGQNWWWEIDYDNWPDGWSREDLLKKVGTNTPPPTTNPLPGDTDGDNDVDIFDYNTLVSDFGKPNSPADFNGNGVVDIFDYNTLVTNFGTGITPGPTPTPSPTQTPPAETCPNGYCDPATEGCNSCPQDCGACPPTDAELLFKSGFEPNTAINNKLIVGFDQSTGYDWARFSRSRYQVSPPIVDPYVPKATDFYFYNEGGTNEIIDGSVVGRPGKVMKFKVYPPDGKRSSVHMYFDESRNWTLGYTFRYMMYISPSFNSYKGSSAYVDPMIFEWKSNWRGENFRGHIRIYMANNEFYWVYRTQEMDYSLPASQWPVITYVENKNIPVPIGRWFLLDIYLKEGEGTDGRLVFRIDGQDVLDVHHSTVNEGAPQSLRAVFPLKLYSFWSEDHQIVDDISYYFDDFEVWRGLPPTNYR